MAEYYSTKQVADLTGASPQIVRVYTNRFTRHFSTEATPEKGAARRFTEADARLIRFVYQLTQAASTYDEIEQRLQAGELEQFAWQPPEEPEPHPEAAAEPGSTMLVPLAQVQAAQALMADAQRREAEAVQREQALQARIAQLERELGQAQGALQQAERARYRAPAWWRAIFGGRPADS